MALSRQSFFQNEPLQEYNMLKLPIIIAPCLLRKQVNNDVEKKSLIDKTIIYKKETFSNFHRLVQMKRINILNIHKMTYAELREVMDALEVPVGDRNATLLRTELGEILHTR